MYLFLQHAVQICPTWMTSCIQFIKTEGLGLVFRREEGGGKSVVCERGLIKFAQHSVKIWLHNNVTDGEMI